MAKNLQVLVAGGGPVGLLTALALAKRDVSVLVLEAEPALTIDLRAGTYHPPSLEMMAPYGITDEMHKRRSRLADSRPAGRVIAQWTSTLRDETPSYRPLDSTGSRQSSTTRSGACRHQVRSDQYRRRPDADRAW
jgi:3-(3-hydroxy-phenyl)propionate hydroxylase